MNLNDSILKMTLQDLDGEDWGEPNYPSHPVTECHRLQRVPVEKLNVENLRLLIGQTISLDYLLPLAIAHLQREPWVSGDYYEGDLLKSVLEVPASFWHSHSELKRAFDEIVERAIVKATAAEAEDADRYDERVFQQLRNWPQMPGA